MTDTEYILHHRAKYGYKRQMKIWKANGFKWVQVTDIRGDKEHSLEMAIPKLLWDMTNFERCVELLHSKLDEAIANEAKD